MGKIYRGNTEITPRRGNSELNKAYRGNSLIWQNVALSTVTQSSFTSITGNSLTLNGNVTDDGGGTITERGFYFGTSTNQASNTKYTVSGTTGAFTLNRTGLALSTTYRSNAFATNSAGTAYSSQISGTTTNWLYGSASGGSAADSYMYPSGGPNTFKYLGGSWTPKVKPGATHTFLVVQDRASGTFMGSFSPPSGYTMSNFSTSMLEGIGSASFSLTSTSISITSTNNGNTAAQVHFTLSS